MPNFLGATFIQGATFIPDSRVYGNVPAISLKYYNSYDSNFSLKNKINLFNGHEIRGARFFEMATVLVFRYSRMCFFGYWGNDLSLDKA